MLHEPGTPGPHTGKSSCSCNGIIRVGKLPSLFRDLQVHRWADRNGL